MWKSKATQDKRSIELAHPWAVILLLQPPGWGASLFHPGEAHDWVTYSHRRAE